MVSEKRAIADLQISRVKSNTSEDRVSGFPQGAERATTYAELDEAGKKRLEALEAELKYVQKTKEAYVKAHPEAKDRVFKQHRPRDGPRPEGDDEEGGEPSDPNSHLYDEHGKLRDPKRSVYYDPVYNPYGVPPPGMPYREISGS